jgi:chromosome segregation protein
VKFTRLRLSGFKSFVEPTDLLIEPGLTGIVGPNGCGKSNLLEGLRWAMGENSFKSMRGSGMEDVIFAGTNMRPARNHAEVTIYMDNQDRSAPSAYNDSESLEVGRRIEKDKGSTYRINGKEVRAKDVQLLFADASTGSHSPALVKQGQITQLINSKPINRRRILEEAAGITGLHTRRHEAELRLKGAETNLTRLDDVVGQLESQLSSLKRQARQATRYRNLSGLIRQAEAVFFHLRWSHAKELLEAEEKRLADTDTRVAEYTEAAAVASTAQAEASEKIPALREAEAVAAAKLHRLTVERENLDAEEKRAREQAERLTARLAQISSDLERESGLIADTDEAIAKLAEEEAALNSENEAQGSAQEEAGTRVASAEEALRARESELDTLANEAAALSAQRQSLERTIEQSAARIEKLIQQLQTIANERETLADAEAKQVAIAQQTEEVETAVGKVLEASDAAEEAEKTLQTARASEAQAREPMNAAEKQLERMLAEAKALGDMLAIGEGDLWPPLIDAVTVEPGYETALGAALGDDLSVPTDTAAPIHWDELPALEAPAPLPHGALPLSQFVRGPAAFGRRLSHIGLVEAGQGSELQKQLKPGQRLVTKEGDLWRWDGFTAAADAPTAAAKRLEQRNRLADLEEEIAEQKALARAARDTFEAARLAAQEAQAKEQELRRALRDAQSHESQLRAELTAAERQASAQLSRLAALAEAEERLSGDLTEARRTHEESTASLEGLRPDGELKEKVVAKREEVGALRIELSEARAALESINREAQARARRLSAIGQERSAWELRSVNARKQIETLGQRKEEAEAELDELKDVPGAIEEKRKSLLSFISQAETERREAADALAEAERHLSECDKLARETQSALSQVREERARIDGLVDGARERKAEAEARIREELNCAAEEALAKAELKEGEELPAVDAIEQKLERLKRERENLGGVNLRADEEAREIEEQLTAMQTEREDLEAAIAKLRQGIASLNREGRERMLAAFEQVNANFSKLFTHLFGGGEAHLKLTESDDPLEAGLEIMARPPGKRLQNMSLLSGGEQTLTATSLIFAVFLTNPSPICVLDEVDAPLDDANVERFCDLMEEMARTTDTRFLIITHHALTMARMHRLFGVTMQERGVSTLVSVDLEAAEQLREAS